MREEEGVQSSIYYVNIASRGPSIHTREEKQWASHSSWKPCVSGHTCRPTLLCLGRPTIAKISIEIR